jgi:hypothetical protein
MLRIICASCAAAVLLSAPVWAQQQHAAEKVAQGNKAAARAAMEGKWKGGIPDQIKGLETLHGVKEGKGAAVDTVYIIVDPRCSYCRATYNATRAYVARGYTIKWIPVVVLADPVAGEQLSASLLKMGTPDAVRRILGNKESIRTKPTARQKKALEYNGQYFDAVFEKAGMSDQAGVPVAFFLDHRDGRARMVMGVSQDAVLKDIFGP